MYWCNKEAHFKPELKYPNLESVGLAENKIHKLLKKWFLGFNRGDTSNIQCLLVFIQ